MKVYRVECNGDFWNCKTQEEAEDLVRILTYSCVATIEEDEVPEKEDPLYWKTHEPDLEHQHYQ